MDMPLELSNTVTLTQYRDPSEAGADRQHTDTSLSIQCPLVSTSHRQMNACESAALQTNLYMHL